MARPGEGNVPVILPADIEPVGIREALGVAVGRAHDGNDGLALTDQPITEHHILGGQSRGVLAGALVTQQFLDRRRYERGVGPQFLQLIGMAQQGEDTIADQVGRRFLSTDHGHNRIGDHFFLAEAIAVDFRREIGADKSIARSALLLPDGSSGNRQPFPPGCE